MSLGYQRAYALLEVLLASLILSFVLAKVVHWQLATLTQASAQFQQLNAINQAQNLLEALRANPTAKEREFARWSLTAAGSYHCDQFKLCQVEVQWGLEKIILNAVI